jgi:hypothetical protein
MRRRVDESNGHGPPETLIDYRLWCAKHSRCAYGIANQPDMMAQARQSWEAWMALRETWARQHRMAELDVPIAADSEEPWSDECLGPWREAL